MKTVIMAGGKGTRISSLASDIPKPMIPINGKPVLEHEIESLRDQGFTDLIITVSHLGSIIMNYFGNGLKFGVHIEYYNESIPLGNAGALLKMRDKLTDDFLLLNADVIFNVDFNRFIQYHKEKNALVTIFTHSNNHPYDSGLLITDNNKVITHWLAKEDQRPKWYHNCVNGGLHVINPVVLDMTRIDSEIVGTVINGSFFKVDLDRQVLKPICKTNRMFSYSSPEYVKDMGTPERYKMVCKDFAEGKILAKNLKEKQRAIFLDRDGTINKHVGFLRDIDQLELLPGVAEAIQTINESGYLAIVVTNQPVIARGEVTELELDEIHKKLETLLGQSGAFVDDIYYCPHHPHKGFPGEVKELKVECNCRKPKPGLILKSAEKYNINLKESWVVGDSQNDVLAGKAAGCHTALIGCENYGQDLTCESLLDFINQMHNLL